MANKRKNHAGISFWETEIMLARTMLDALRTTVEFLYYMMEHRSKAPFSMILITSDRFQSISELQQMKRGSDLLFELDKERGTYVIICQATDQIGAEQYADILLSGIRANRSIGDIYCVLTTLTSTRHSLQDVIFKMVETYIHARKIGRSGEVIVSNLSDEETEEEALPIQK